jgi:phosphoglycerate dehydrogenase-like enzyme
LPLRVLVLDDYQGAARQFGPWSRLDDLDIDLGVQTTHLDGEPLNDALRGADIVIAMRERTPFTRDVLDSAPQLKLLVTTGLANAAIDLGACRERGIEVCGTGGLRSSTAELTWGLILALARHVVAEDRSIRVGGWQHTIGLELAGAQLGVIGLGHLGGEVARVGLAFGMEVVAWSQHLQAERAAEVGVRCVSKEELLSTSDVVSLHLKLSDRTRGIIGAAELALMRPAAYLVNTSRGPLIDEAALIDAVRARRIAGVGLDVFDVEPLPTDHPLRSLPNSVLTPHVGYVTGATYREWWSQVVDDIRAWADGSAVRLLT